MKKPKRYYTTKPASLILEEMKQELMLSRFHGYMRFVDLAAEQFGLEVTGRIMVKDKRSGEILR